MLSDWESSLTEFSSDEDEYVPTPRRRKAPRKTHNEYKVDGPLKPYRTTTYTVKSLYDQIIDNTIELNPEYQRDIVWTDLKQSGLIDSILRNYYIPPVIFSVTSHDDGTQSRVCIDGKQRLTSIQMFMDGFIAHRDIKGSKKYWYRTAAGEHRLILPKPLIQAFANKQITCIEYDALTDDQEREIFQRVQLGVALTAAERMQAIAGTWPSLIRKVQSFVLGDDGFGEDLDWGHDRGRDFQCLATIIYLIIHHPKTSFPTSPRLEKWLLSTDPVSAELRDSVLETFQIFIALVKNKKHNAAFQKPSRVSPVEFTMIGVLIHLFKSYYSFMQLSSAIWQMRADIRKQFQAIRANSKVTKAMFDFLNRRLRGCELASDGKGDKPAAVAIKKVVGSAIVEANKYSNATKEQEKRRRREDWETSGGSEYEESPTKRRASMPQIPSSRSTTSKVATSKATVARKVSAPVVSYKISGPKVKASVRSRKNLQTAQASHPQASVSSSHPSPPVAVQDFPVQLTTRTTRTALSAAADLLFGSELPTSQEQICDPLAASLSRKRASQSTPQIVEQEPVMKMEVDPPTLIPAADENAMLIEGGPHRAQAGYGGTSHNGTTAESRQSPSVTLNASANPNATSEQSTSRSAENLWSQHGLSVNTTLTLPSVPVPPPPPSMSTPGTPLSASGSLQRLASMSILDKRPPPSTPIGDREHMSIDGWVVDRARDRDRDGDRDRELERYDAHFSGKDRDKDRDRDRVRANLREWERPDRDWKRRDKSRDRDYGRDRNNYNGWERRRNW